VTVIPTSHIRTVSQKTRMLDTLDTVAQSQLNATAVTKYQFTHESTEKNQLMKL